MFECTENKKHMSDTNNKNLEELVPISKDCEQWLHKIQACYKNNKGVYGCEVFIEKFDDCRRQQIEDYRQSQEEQEWLAFKKQYIAEKRAKKQ